MLNKKKTKSEPRRAENYRIVQKGMDPEYKPMPIVSVCKDVPVAGGIWRKKGDSFEDGEIEKDKNIIL